MKIDKAKFLLALESVSAGLTTGQESVEQSSCFVFTEEHLCTYNDEVSCRMETPLPGVVGAVPAVKLLDLLPKLPESEIDVSAKGGKLLVRGKSKRATFTMEADITLPLDTVEVPKKWRKLHPGFADAVGVVQHCAGKDINNFHLTCIHMTPDFVEACDNFQVCRYPVPTGLREACLVRRSSLKHVVSLACTKVAETPNWLHWQSAAGVCLSMRREVADYPDLEAFLHDEGEPVTLPGGLSEAVERAEVFAETGDGGCLHVDLQRDRLRLVGQSIAGEYEERRSVSYRGPSLSFLIAPKLLVDVSNRATECKVQQNKLMVNGGAYKYVTVLGAPE